MIKTYLYWNINENKESMFIFIEMNHYICFFYKGCPDGTNPDQIRCLVDACTYEKCPRFPEADCVSVPFLHSS